LLRPVAAHKKIKYIRGMKSRSLIFLLLLLPVGLPAQVEGIRGRNPTGAAFPTTEEPVYGGAGGESAGNYDPDRRILRMSVLTDDYTGEEIIPFDTVFYLPHRFREADDFSTFNATLGNYGLPFYQINFFDRVREADRFLYSFYYPFMHLQSNAVFMDTQVPFTELRWSNSEPRSMANQTFKVRHTQNVNKSLNFGLVYDIIYDLGQYNHQKAENKTFAFFSSYKGKKYDYYLSAGINNIASKENGGMLSTDMNTLAGLGTKDVPVNLSGINQAMNLLRNRNILFVQKYHLGRDNVGETDSIGTKREPFIKGTISHILEAETNRKSYTDARPSSGYYDSIYISSSKTFDSLYYRNIKNSLRFDFLANDAGKFRLGGGAGVRHEYHKYGQIVPTFDTIIADTTSLYHNNIALMGKIYNDIGDNFGWKVDGELYLLGYRSGDFQVKGAITKRFDFRKGGATLAVTGSISNSQPSFWYSHWGSNHFVWDNNLEKEFRTDVGSSFSFPARNFEVDFRYAIIDNYTYFGEEAIPTQYAKPLSITSLTVSKRMALWKFHFDNDLLLQVSGAPEAVDLPLVAVRSTFYFQHLFRFKSTGGRLNTQIGAEVTYYTKYFPYAYMPSTNLFYAQSEHTAGNYPFIDVFVDLNLKRARIFIMYDHINQGMMGYNYYHVPFYPLNISMLRYGLAWTFYN
jgi:hypothetical protein